MTDRMTPEGLEACFAFGAASIAFIAARQFLDEHLEVSVAAAHEELTLAHEDLRRLFAAGDSQGVPGLALSVIVLAERVTTQLE